MAFGWSAQSAYRTERAESRRAGRTLGAVPRLQRVARREGHGAGFDIGFAPGAVAVVTVGGIAWAPIPGACEFGIPRRAGCR
jgi:hypothetical protein